MNRRLIALLALIVLAIVGLYFAFAAFNPTPPKTVVMSTGPAGSANALFAEQYREYLAANGIELELRESDGTIENLERLQDPDGDVGVSFVTMGISVTRDTVGVESLGTVYFQPIWFFFRAPEVTKSNIQEALGRRLAIGLPGSTTNLAARRILELNGIDVSQIEMLNIEPNEAAKRIKAGTVDSAVFVTAASTPMIRDLLATEGVTLANFERADAYIALFPPLSKLRVPAGLGDLARNLPPRDTNIVSFSSILAIRTDLHPAIQTLLLDAATQIHAVPDIFHTSGRFPAPRVFNIPLSSNATNYYQSGKPFLHRYLPFWLAVLVMQILVAALPLLGVIYPVAKSLPALFDWAMQRRVLNIYVQLRAVESRINAESSNISQAELLQDLAQIERNVQQLRVPVTLAHRVFGLRAHVEVVRARILSASS